MKQFWNWAWWSDSVEAYLFILLSVVLTIVVFLLLAVVTKGTIIIPLVFVLFFLVYKKYKEETSETKGDYK